ncbi:MAG: hypothetical protein HYX92_06670 [Chloroflexi bacterium]|nr:hypothetical protein [Chloroflexota bacterium]
MKTANLIASFSGVSGLTIAGYPGAIALQTEAEIRESLENGVFDRIVEGLTRQPEGASAGADEADEMVFTGGLDEVNRVFYERRWTDGLAIIPPTVDRVEEFLKHTNRSADEAIAVLPQANLIATPRNIAANAVMAGCRPEFMPLLVAAVEAVADPHFQLMNLGSTGCKTPWLLMNGPIVKELGIEYGVALRSRGPNPVLGRALGLILSNVAGFKPGETLMGTFGYFLPFALAEDEDACEEIGWQPYHVEKGFSRDTSTVTARTTVYWGGQGTPGGWTSSRPGEPVPPTAGSILEVACRHVERNTQAELSLKYGDRNMVTLLVTPPTARILAAGGHSKRDVAEYVWKHSRISVQDVNDILQAYKGDGPTVHELVQDGVLPASFDVGTRESVPLFVSPDLIDIVVCGDAYRDKMMSLWCNYNRPVTRPVELK